MKTFLVILLNLMLVAYLILGLSFSSQKEKELLCNDIQIDMLDTLNSGFLTKTDIEEIILREESEILGYPVININTRNLENRLRSFPYVKEAEAYYDMEGILYVKISQRRPVMRILTGRGNSYYIDSEGYVFPPRGGFTPHILVCNGYFTEGNEIRNIRNLSELKDDDRYKEWTDALELALFIEKDKFWKAQLVQVYLNSKNEFEIIPRVGAHQIILGGTDMLEEKFGKLLILYRDGFDYEGWNKYEKINLKYKNQVICTKR